MKISLRQIIVSKTQRFVWAFANAYGLKVSRAGLASGQHPLFVEGGDLQVAHCIPASCYFNTRSGSISIGRDTVFGEDVKVLTGKHANVHEAEEFNVPLQHVPETGRDIAIGRSCYVGSGAIIIGPVTIGDFTVIGAGAVVTKSLPSRVFAAGNPARIIRNL